MIFLLFTLAASLVAHTESAALFPFTFRIPHANHTRDLSSIIMVPAVGPVSSDTQVLRSIFDGFSFWATSQAVKLDPLSDSLGTSVTSSVISSGSVPVADKPAETAAEPAAAAAESAVADPIVKEITAADHEPVTADEVKEPAAIELELVVADEVKEPLAVELQAVKSDAPSGESAPTVEAPSSEPVEVPASDAIEAPSTLAPVADEAESVIEPVVQTTESVSSDMEIVPEQDSVTEHSMDPVVISALEPLISDVSQAAESTDVISFDTSIMERQTPAANPTPYSDTTCYLQDMSFNGYDMYSRPAATPLECGNTHCSGDSMCTHFNWIPSGTGGTCFLKNRPSSGWFWAQPSIKPTPSASYCGFIPKRTCPPALISICIYIDAIIQLPFISALIG